MKPNQSQNRAVVSGWIAGLLGVLLAVLVAPTHAEATSVPTPALEAPAGALFSEVRSCVAGSVFGSDTDGVANQVEAWFEEFHAPRYPQALRRLYARSTDVSTVELAADEALVRRLRSRVDYRVEQALIATVDAAMRSNGDSSECRGPIAQLLLRLAAQRDRAWAWADALERLIRMKDSEAAAYASLEDLRASLREVERRNARLRPYLGREGLRPARYPH